MMLLSINVNIEWTCPQQSALKPVIKFHYASVAPPSPKYEAELKYKL